MTKIQNDLTGRTYYLETGVYAGQVAAIKGRDNLFPNEDRWLVEACGHRWGVSGLALRNVIAYQQTELDKVCP